MARAIRILFLAGLLAIATLAIETQASSPSIDVLEIKGTINPVLAEFIERGIGHAEESNAVACIIQMDTPGGLDKAMRDIVKRIVSARVPVVVYVAPAGARAASAGVFITIAAHVAAMAPNTTIGAAHPVSVGAEGEQQMSKTMEDKVVSDAAAYIRSIASAHGRNMEWAEKAVRESVSATEQEALGLSVVDMVAPDLHALISQLNGRQVAMLDGRMVTLQTQGATINTIEMNWVEGLLHTIADPNIAYILMSLAVLGLMVEISNPGLIFPGVVGGISLLMALYALGVLPVNYAGVLLILLAFGLFIAEVFTGSGILAAGGIVSLIIGSSILFKGGPLFRINPWLIVGVTLFIAIVFGFVIMQVVRAHLSQPSTGKEELAGKTALVKVALKPEGTVLFKGELWTAVSEEGKVEPGEEVIITRVDGLKLWVTKSKKEVNK